MEPPAAEYRNHPPRGCGPAEGHEVGLFVAHGGPALGTLSARNQPALTLTRSRPLFLA
jgi:hypothetical protein